jgi:hypothetical protein
MEVYKIVITVIALVIVTLLSVLAEMLGNAQENRRLAPSDRRKNKQDDATPLRGSQPRLDRLQDRDAVQIDVRKPMEAIAKQIR